MLKDIIERDSAPSIPPAAPQPPAPGSTGFPVAVHRSQRPSAFARARQQQANASVRGPVAEGRAVVSVPILQTSQPSGHALSFETGKDNDDRQTMELENTRRVKAMTDVERQQEVDEIKERFGDGILDLMRKRKEAREGKATNTAVEALYAASSSSPSSCRQNLDNSPTVDPNDAQRILRDVSEENDRTIAAMTESERIEEVRELEERFGGRLISTLRARAEQRSVKGKERAVEPKGVRFATEPFDMQASAPFKREDDSLAALKAKYFPNVRTEPSKLEWLQPPSASSSSSSSSTDKSTRYDLLGNALSASAKTDLPSHLGLHHHGSSPDLAGYTLDDILHLCRSTVPSQRIAMMSVLARIVSTAHTAGKTASGAEDETARGAGSIDGGSTSANQPDTELPRAIKAAVELGVEVLSGLTRGVGVIRAGVNLLFEALGGSTWTWLDSDDVLSRSFDFKASENTSGISAIPFEDVLPRMTELLSVEGIESGTAQQLIVILRRATLISPELCETICPIVPVIVRQHVVQKAWPPRSDDCPSIEALRLLRDITFSSRACGEELLRQGVYETILKFVVTATWEGSDLDNGSEATVAIGQALALEVLRSYIALGRYGLGSSVVASSAEVWRRLGAWALDRAPSASKLEQRVVSAYFDCLTIWTTCAIDPHRTTPEHDITWAQVVALSWADDGLAAVKLLVRAKRWEETASALDSLAAWITGAQVNGVRGGEEEKKHLLDALREAELRPAVVDIHANCREEYQTRMLAVVVQLHHLLRSEGELLDVGSLNMLRDCMFSGDPGRNHATTLLRYNLLGVDISVPSVPMASTWLPSAIRLLSDFEVGDEPLALDLVDAILRADWKATECSVADQLESLAHPDGLQLLRPLLHYAILPDVENIVGPRRPSHIYLKATATLRAPSTMKRTNIKTSIVGLPLQPDWVFSALNELLRSGDSIALSQVPPDWSASETEIVQATLVLAQMVTQYTPGLDRAHILMNMMKVYMLEHGQHSALTTSESEVFRDTRIADALQRLMTPLLVAPPSEDTSRAPTAQIEVASRPFLGPGVPFFQFYTDFVALYEAISFSETLFTQLLLPPLAMAYPADYRKLLWNDHSTALRGMRLRLGQVPLESPQGIEAYFKPIETNKEVLHGYARALLRGWVTEERTEFMFSLAAHHLAGLFWQGTEEDKESTRVGLMIMLLSGGSEALIRRILEWDLVALGGAVNEQEMNARKGVVGSLTGAKGLARIERL